MPTLSELSVKCQNERLQRGELQLRVGPYTYQMQSSLPTVVEGISTLYSNFNTPNPDNFIDYSISLRHTGILSRLRNQVEFYFDNQRPFATIKIHQAYAFMEWGMNWCVSIHANEYLKLHAAVVAMHGRAIIMPGLPGAGKSTLCAALGLSGWRVLSDEHALIPPGTSSVIPLYRPISLKNESISIIAEFDKSAIFGPTSKGTHKGVVAHLKADLAPDSHDAEAVPVSAMVFPRYSKEDPQGLFPRKKTQSFLLAAYHSFNYSLLGPSGFQAMVKLLDSVECYDLVYRDLEWALQTMEHFHGENTQ